MKMLQRRARIVKISSRYRTNDLRAVATELW